MQKVRRMHTFTMFRHPAGKTVALKAGWSWFAFFFSVVWLLNKHLWSRALSGIVAISTVVFLWLSVTELVGAVNTDKITLLSTILIVVLQGIMWLSTGLLTLWLLVYVPRKAHTWKSQHLIRSGYEKLGTVKAFNSEGAHAVWIMQREAQHTPENAAV